MLERRDWMRLVAVLAAGRVSASAEVNREQLTTAVKLLGLDFSDADVTTMLPNVNRAVEGYGRLRKIEVPLDTEPAIAFHPGLPGRTVSTEKPRVAPTKVDAKAIIFRNVEELAFRPVTDLAALLRARRVTSTDLTRMYLERLKKYSPQLLCVITLTEERALKQAAQADDEIKRGKIRGPLHGIPWGAKDLFATKGIRTTWGAEPFEKQMIDVDATVVERLDRAGAVLVAKLSMGALAQGGLWFGGMTKTPWNVERTSSGSSAGSASATSAGLVGFSIGTETLGSIISPSIRCGVTGLRPTYGRVSRYGAMGLSWTMDKIGPICRSVEDGVLVLNAIYGPDGRDRTVTADPLHWEPARPLAGMRIGILEKAFASVTQADEKKLFEQAIADLKKAGVAMKPVEIPDESSGAISFLLSAEAAAAFDDITRDGRVRTLKGQAPGDWPNTFRTSRLIPAVEYLRAQRVRTRLMEQTEKAFADWDVIVAPPFPLMRLTNLTGHPQIVVPCGFAADNLPRGLSFYGRLYDEGSPARVAHAFQQVTDWHKRQPPVGKLG